MEKLLGAEHPDVATCMNNLGDFYCGRGRYSEAEPLIRQALAIREKSLGPEHRKVATSLNNLAVLYTIQGQYTAAEPLFLRALAIGKKTAVADPVEMAKILRNYGILLRKTKRKSEAAKMMAQADDLLKNNLPGKLAQHTVHARSLMSTRDSSVFDRAWR